MKKDIIPHSRPTIGKEEKEAVSKVVASGRIAQGREVEAFEQAFADKIGVRYAAAVSTGTAALHLALMALGAGAEDEVIMPSYVCTALLNAVHYVGATPVITDIDPVSLNIDPVDAARRITPRTKAIIVPHMFGLAADLDQLTGLGVPVIEDCAQAPGAHYKGQAVGSLGAAAIFSFYATKMLTCGEGGMVVSNSTEIIDRVRQYREYDNRNAYAVRFNYKMTDFQAAMGRQQLKKLAGFISRRREIADLYNRSFGQQGLRLAPEQDNLYYRYIIRLNQDVDPCIRAMEEEGIACARPVYRPLHQYQGLAGYAAAESVFQQALSIPIYPTLSEAETARVMDAVTRTCKRIMA